MPTDLLARLQADPGTRTFGELVQERQWALQEIHRLRALLAREETARSRYVQRAEKRPKEEADPTDKPRIHPAQFLSLAEITKHFGLSRSTIYAMKRQGRFPEPLRFGLRTVRWKYEDLMAWEDTLRC